MGACGFDPMGGIGQIAQGRRIQPAAIAVLHRKAKGMTLVAVNHAKRRAKGQLPFPRPIRVAQKVHQPRSDPQNLPIGLWQICAAQTAVGDAGRGGIKPAIQLQPQHSRQRQKQRPRALAHAALGSGGLIGGSVAVDVKMHIARMIGKTA